MGKWLRGVCVWLTLLFPHCYCHTARVISHCFPLSRSISLLLLSVSFIKSVLQSTCWEHSHLLHVFHFCFHLTFPIKQDFRVQHWSALFILLLCAHSCICQHVNSRFVEDSLHILIADFCLSEEKRIERDCFKTLCQMWEANLNYLELCCFVPRVLAFRSQIVHLLGMKFSPWNFTS